MTTTRCPDGHDSESDDYCSVCGAALTGASSVPSGAAPSAPDGTSPSAEGNRCGNCGAAHRPEDVFCESCGLDFATGTLPQAASDPAPTSNQGPPGVVRVGVDSVWFEKAVGAGELTLPEPIPDAVTVPLPGSKALVGRQSQSRGVFPEVDLAKITGDPAVSTRHALIERDGQNGWTITDVGSTNGTLVGAEVGTAVELQSGVAVPFGPGDTAWLGAWTRIDFGS